MTEIKDHGATAVSLALIDIKPSAGIAMTQDIAGTTMFDGDQAQKGLALNRMCFSFNSAENRAAFVKDEEGYCRKYGLNEEQRAAIKAATKLIDILKVQRAPSFGVIFEMASFKDKSPSGEFYNYAFEMVGPVEDRAFYEENFAQYRFFIEHGLKVKDLEGAQEDEASSAEEKF